MSQGPAKKLRVLTDQQRVEVLCDGHVSASFPVSTAAKGLGEEPGSYRTPRGRFRISRKIGDGMPLGAVFKGRLWTGQIWPQDKTAFTAEDDLILTRILWLEGIEPHNTNTLERYIYFHGTNQENRIGQPSSHGCIRLSNADMLALYDSVGDGDEVEIV